VRRRDDEVVGQLIEGPLDAEVRAEREREDKGVGRHVAAAVVAHEQYGPLGRNPVHVLHVGPEYSDASSHVTGSWSRI